jgi:haloacetate dehalogenase
VFDGFARSEIKTSGARIVAVHGGRGPPLLLMHGNPFSHLSWHKFAPQLAREFTVVATDLRGYGDSEKPAGGKDHSAYSFRAMAQDQIEVRPPSASRVSTLQATIAARACCTACASIIPNA